MFLLLGERAGGSWQLLGDFLLLLLLLLIIPLLPGTTRGCQGRQGAAWTRQGAPRSHPEEDPRHQEATGRSRSLTSSEGQLGKHTVVCIDTYDYNGIR